MEVEKKGGNSELVLKYHVDGRQKSLGPNAEPLQIYKYCVLEERAKKKNSSLFSNFQNGELAVGLHCL